MESQTASDEPNGHVPPPSGPLPSMAKAPEAKPELSNAEKKKLLKAEKAARRAKEKDSKSGVVSTPASGLPSTTTTGKANPSSTAPIPTKQQQQQQDLKKLQSAQKGEATVVLASTQLISRIKPVTKAEKTAEFCLHLQTQPRHYTLAGTPKDVHPTISSLALHISNYSICGSHARTAAMLVALKSVIQSYITPRGTSLPRHLASQFLSPHLAHLKSARPFAMAQSNSIRWLKNLIANVDPSVPEEKAKNDLCREIDHFVRRRLAIPKSRIASAIAKEIEDNQVILTFANSAIVRSALLKAAGIGKTFRVVVLDSRPLLEGRHLAQQLDSAGIEVQYGFLNGLEQATKDVTRCLLGAHAVFGDGSVYSRTGTAMVAMVAKAQGIPVTVCAESIKFTERIVLDSVMMNEIAPSEELLADLPNIPNLTSVFNEQDNLYLLNLLYDVTPAKYVDNIASEKTGTGGNTAPTTTKSSAQRIR